VAAGMGQWRRMGIGGVKCGLGGFR
jgi:hypothetical protein